MQSSRSRLIDVIESLGLDADGVPSRDMLELEEDIFGATHQHFGAALCEKWKFPNSLVLVTGHHHRPLELSAESRTLTSVVYVADRLVGGLEDGFRLDLPSLEMDPDVLDAIHLGAEQIERIREKLPSMVVAATATLG